jgi:hypothetical protein
MATRGIWRTDDRRSRLVSESADVGQPRGDVANLVEVRQQHRRRVPLIGSFFAGVADTYITSSIVPETGIATLADVINGIGVATIAAIMFQTIISQHIYDEQKQEVLFRCIR